MQTHELLKSLLTQKYVKPIALEGNYAASKTASLFNPESGTVFSVAADFLFMFQDQNRNAWFTIPKHFTVNGRKYIPELGDILTKRDGTFYHFITKEAIIEMAWNYFEQFKNPNYAIETITSGAYFFENSDDKTDKYFVVFQKFKSLIHAQIQAFISSN